MTILEEKKRMNIREAIEIIEDFKAMDDWTAVYCPPMHEALDVVVNEALRKPKLTWIPCSERLPKETGGYLVTIEMIDGTFEIDIDKFMINKWNYYEWNYYEKETVTAWMPLLEPYRGDD